MQRHEILEMMAALKLAGMRAAFDELLADGLKRRHPVQKIIGQLLKAEIADKQPYHARILSNCLTPGVRFCCFQVL